MTKSNKKLFSCSKDDIIQRASNPMIGDSISNNIVDISVISVDTNKVDYCWCGSMGVQTHTVTINEWIRLVSRHIFEGSIFQRQTEGLIIMCTPQKNKGKQMKKQKSVELLVTESRKQLEKISREISNEIYPLSNLPEKLHHNQIACAVRSINLAIEILGCIKPIWASGKIPENSTPIITYR